jgi:hypothetical protein
MSTKNRQNAAEPAKLSYLVQRDRQADIIIEVAADWKLTFGAVNPGARSPASTTSCTACASGRARSCARSSATCAASATSRSRWPRRSRRRRARRRGRRTPAATSSAPRLGRSSPATKCPTKTCRSDARAQPEDEGGARAARGRRAAGQRDRALDRRRADEPWDGGGRRGRRRRLAARAQARVGETMHIDGCHWFASSYECGCGAQAARPSSARSTSTPYSAMWLDDSGCERCQEILAGARTKHSVTIVRPGKAPAIPRIGRAS